MSKIAIRTIQKTDVPRLLELIKELADFEKSLHKVSNTEADMERDGFGSTPVFDGFVAVEENKIVGMSLYYYRYSTWKGKVLFLEDLYVQESKRGQGIGKYLFEATLTYAKESSCKGMMWQVLDWNQNAIDFYKRYDCKLDDEWINCLIVF